MLGASATDMSTKASRHDFRDSRLLAPPARALKSIVHKQISGRLTVRDPYQEGVCWRVYVGRGQVHFATSTTGQAERLAYLLQWYCPELPPAVASKARSDYAYICQYWRSGELSLRRMRQLLFWLSQEAFVHLLSLPQAKLQFEKTVGLDPLLLSVPVRRTIEPIRGIINRSRSLHPHIRSPFQRPVLIDRDRALKTLRDRLRNPQFSEQLARLLDRQACFYELAYHLHADTLAISMLLHPLVRDGAIAIEPYRHPRHLNQGTIACVDDSKTVQRQVQLMLEAAGYRILQFTDPTIAARSLVQQPPDLILMDINMPHIDGYELCRRLRHNPNFPDIPIIMLTGREGLIDRLRSRMVGADEFITKPFSSDVLLQAIGDRLQTERPSIVGPQKNWLFSPLPAIG
jgi:twitching motility two-component system response regulator PilG